MIKNYFLVFFVLFGMSTYAQLTNEIYLKDLYVNTQTRKLKDSVLFYQNKSRKQIKDLTKKVLNATYPNLNELITSESEELIVLEDNLRVDGSFKIFGKLNETRNIYKIRLELSFKDSKMRVEMFDGGLYKIITLSSMETIDPARATYLDSYFDFDVIKSIDMQGTTALEYRHRTANSIINYINRLYSDLISIKFDSKSDNW